jgi:serine protease Do
MKLKALSIALISAGVIAAGTAGAVNWNPSTWFAKPEASAPAPTRIAATTPVAAPVANTAPIGPMTAPNYRAIVQQFGPAVVNVTTEGTVKAGLDGLAEGIPDELQQFFRNFPGFGGQGPRGRMPREDSPARGLGSGFIVNADGIILTNAHVVRDASEVTVKLSDRREFKAKVLGSDPATDIAVLKIEAKNLPVVRLGNAAQLGVGDYVLAIGSPYGFEQSATSGIVSAMGRSLPGDASVPFIQTDVAVNPGNSGGPLFDAAGNVVGINSQIYSRTGGYQGLSFAIPIEVAMNVQEQIATTGKVRHARLGVTVQDLTQTLAESFKLRDPNGALVSNVMPGSAAAKAGLESGDVILRYNGQVIGRSGDLPALVAMAKPGDKVMLQVWRGGKTVELPVSLAEATKVASADDASSPGAAHGKLGVAVRPLTAEEKKDGKLASGVVVEQASGAAARAGIQAGDVIMSINGMPVKDVEQLREAVAKSKSQVALLVRRGDDQIFVPVKIG